jgi:hypothetical protein
MVFFVDMVGLYMDLSVDLVVGLLVDDLVAVAGLFYRNLAVVDHEEDHEVVVAVHTEAEILFACPLVVVLTFAVF